ncbi:MAG: hypothetical protein ROD09_16410 [Candidatus Sedimenticola sp. (ex Thyasira tokunagai)]
MGNQEKVYKQIGKLYEMVESEERAFEEEQRIVDSLQRKKYVKRDAFKKIIAAWVITVPVAAVLSASIFFMIRGMML